MTIFLLFWQTGGLKNFPAHLSRRELRRILSPALTFHKFRALVPNLELPM